MKILLDTHVLLWALTGSKRLSRKAHRLISDPDNDIYVSIISPWEVGIKHNKFPERMPIGSSDLFKYCKQSGYKLLSVKPSHINLLSDLDQCIHSDPFDRMLICQAKAEQMTLITCDERISQYNEPCILKIK